MGRIGLLAAVACVAAIGTHVAAEERFTSRSGADVVIRPLVHASVRVDFDGAVVYVDPWSRADLDGAPPADVILITDADAGAHHLDTAAIQKLRKPSTVVVVPASGKAKVPDGLVMANGDRRTFGALQVESLGSYDLLPGEPFHAPGVANGYLLTIGGMRILFAGVTECVPEIRRLQDLDVVFMPMNLPNGRMTVDAAASCIAGLAPKVAYPYHYDQGYIARQAGRSAPASAEDAARSVQALAAALAGKVDVRTADWYPVK